MPRYRNAYATSTYGGDLVTALIHHRHGVKNFDVLGADIATRNPARIPHLRRAPQVRDASAPKIDGAGHVSHPSLHGMIAGGVGRFA